MSHSGSDSKPGVNRGLGFPIYFFLGIQPRFSGLVLWNFSLFVTTIRFFKAYFLRGVSPGCTAQGPHPSVGPLSPQRKKST